MLPSTLPSLYIITARLSFITELINTSSMTEVVARDYRYYRTRLRGGGAWRGGGTRGLICAMIAALSRWRLLPRFTCKHLVRPDKTQLSYAF